MSNMDQNVVLDNLKELNDISLKIFKEYDQKNKILQGGLKDYEVRKTRTDKINKRNNA